jgi:hypothetical protein
MKKREKGKQKTVENQKPLSTKNEPKNLTNIPKTGKE